MPPRVVLLSIALSQLVSGAITAEQIRQIARDRIARRAAVGLAIGCIQDGKEIIVVEGAGVAAATVFEIGSITKTFTATVLAQMVREGKVALHDTIRQHLPEARDWKGVGDIPLIQLATHSSGLPRIPIDPMFALRMIANRRNPYANYTVPDLYDYLRANGEYKPGPPRPFAYSNLGVGLLGNVLASKDGVDYETMVRRRILEPLAMTSTAITLSPGLTTRIARGHDTNLREVALWDLPALQGAGALRSDIRDMMRYLRANMEVAPPIDVLAHQAHAAGDDKDTSVGLGWVIDSSRGDAIHAHDGGTGGFRTFIGFSKSRKAGAVVLSNTATGVNDIGFHLVNPDYRLKQEPRTWNRILAAAGVGIPLFAVATLALSWRPARSRWFVMLRIVSAIPLILLGVRLGPWEWTGAIVPAAFQLGGLLLGAALLWRCQHLPWTTPQRWWRWASDAASIAVSLLMCAFVIFSL